MTYMDMLEKAQDEEYTRQVAKKDAHNEALKYLRDYYNETHQWYHAELLKLQSLVNGAVLRCQQDSLDLDRTYSGFNAEDFDFHAGQVARLRERCFSIWVAYRAIKRKKVE
jgi:hypothetical protein